MSNRDTYKYELRDGNRLVYVGISKNPEQREQQHLADKDFTRMKIIGRATTEERAGEWEEQRIATYKANHHGERPKYNQNDSGK